jgi:hypothetical protein
MAKKAVIATSPAPAEYPDAESEARKLVEALEKERGGRTLSLGKVTKAMGAMQQLQSADPQVQAAFVRHIVATYARLGTPKGKSRPEWFRGKAVPSAGAEAVRLLLRKKLPFTDEMLAEMFQQMSGVSYLSLVEFNDALARALEQRAKVGPLSPPLRKAAARFADVLAVRHVPKAEAKHWRDEWGFPRAEDRKVAARIDRLAGGPL